MRISKAITGLALALALGGCGLPNSVRSVFVQPLNPGTPIQTSPGNFTVTSDDVNAAVANAAAVQQVAVTCANLQQTGRIVNTSSAARDGRNYFTINFQCQ